MKTKISQSKEYIPGIGKFLYIERYNDGSAFYCLMDKYGDFNVADVGRTYEEIKARIELWKGLVERHVIVVR